MTLVALPRPPSFDGEPNAQAYAQELLRQASSGSGEAFESLYNLCAPACLGLARRIVVDPGLAQDVVQQVFINIWEQGSRYEPAKGSAVGWILTITHHKAVDCVRREERRRRHQTSDDQLPELASTLPLPDDTACLSAERAAVRGALASLPDRQRQVLLLAYFGGYTYAEVAGLVRVPLSTVKSRCRVGMATMRSLLTAGGHHGVTGGASGTPVKAG